MYTLYTYNTYPIYSSLETDLIFFRRTLTTLKSDLYFFYKPLTFTKYYADKQCTQETDLYFNMVLEAHPLLWRPNFDTLESRDEHNLETNHII